MIVKDYYEEIALVGDTWSEAAITRTNLISPIT